MDGKWILSFPEYTPQYIVEYYTLEYYTLTDVTLLFGGGEACKVFPG